jgi:hypothetical protein
MIEWLKRACYVLLTVVVVGGLLRGVDWWLGSTHSQQNESLPEVASDRCVKKADEFTGNEGVRCPPRELTIDEQPGEHLYRAYARIAGVEGTPALLIQSASKSINFLEVQRVYALLDGDRYTFSVSPFDTNFEDRRVIEGKLARLTRNQLESLASADTIRFRMGNAVFRVTADSLSYDAAYLLQYSR